jgi:hypothetical protein
MEIFRISRLIHGKIRTKWIAAFSRQAPEWLDREGGRVN